jgi:hypothetical protein
MNPKSETVMNAPDAKVTRTQKSTQWPLYAPPIPIAQHVTDIARAAKRRLSEWSGDARQTIPAKVRKTAATISRNKLSIAEPLWPLAGRPNRICVRE